MHVADLTPEYAADIATWRYPPPYQRYDLSEAAPLLDPANGFVALLDGAELIGFRSFGPDGQVPGGRYDDSALDTGGGLRPSRTGRGLGRQALAVGLAYGRERFAPPAFRVTVAADNERALRVVGSSGFVRVDEFAATTTGLRYVVLVRPER
ncbi:N-acetyltransferase [Actinocatenispora thailandica]|uniref:N-acetyltransferase n=1 Tax=Actinocatenispora thailandica TaxID=227318 RepID=A0A7R7DJH0_9ACTN|nr:GNAT family protein [Actinocatenispora thailandica]BCJ32847.1 N-acetyltransferase [Actinocatenispora thailandica]